MSTKSVVVIHLTHTDPSRDSRILKELNCVSEYFTQNNIRSQILALGVSSSLGPPPSDSHAFTINSVKPVRIRLPVFRHFQHLCNFVRFSAFFVRKSIIYSRLVIHCHDVYSLPAAAIIKFLKPRTRLIYDAHELESETNSQGKIESFLVKTCEFFLWRLIDSFITVSPSILSWYHRYYGKKSSYLVLNSPVIAEDSTDYICDISLKHSLSIPESEKLFLYVGAIGAGRGIHLIMNVFSSRPSDHVLFIGWGELVEDIQEAMSSFGNIHYMKPMPHDQLLHCTRQADYGICMIENISKSDYFCLPNKLFEFAFSGLPVIASKFPDISNVVSSCNLGILSEHSINDLSRCIDLIKAKQFNFNDAKLSQLSWSNQCHEIIACYQQNLEVLS
jgi:glycosyltransferase involved in cell wall biosynthesis